MRFVDLNDKLTVNTDEIAYVEEAKHSFSEEHSTVIHFNHVPWVVVQMPIDEVRAKLNTSS